MQGYRVAVGSHRLDQGRVPRQLRCQPANLGTLSLPSSDTAISGWVVLFTLKVSSTAGDRSFDRPYPISSMTLGTPTTGGPGH